MFTRHPLPDGTTVLRSSLLDERGIPHAFTTADRDVRGPGDLVGVIERNPEIRTARQVHGRALSGPNHWCDEADALVSDDSAVAVAVRTADCVPVLLASSDGSVVAAVHAGWRGLDPAVGVIAAAVATLPSPASCVAAVGPCISVTQYEVGEEVAAPFRSTYPTAVRDDLGPKPHLDLRTVAAQQLAAAGLPAVSIDIYPGCTFAEPGLHSYRRHGPGVPHLAAVVAPA
ncbi:MAG: polyphenol oxidase family protein [Planctomycetota bacterium]